MKKLLLWSFFLVLTCSVFGQKAAEKSARKEAKHYIKVLNLSEAQVPGIEAIFVHKFESLEELSSLESTAPDQFRAKRRAVYAGTDQSIRMLLNRSQLDLFEIEKRRQRLANAAQIEKLQKQGAGNEEILDAQYGIKN
jgi:hypothetical protein